MEFELRTMEDRKKAIIEIRSAMLRETLKGKPPTFAFLHFSNDGTLDNHFMTPMPFEKIDEEGTRFMNVADIDFFLSVFLTMPNVSHVEYDPEKNYLYIDIYDPGNLNLDDWFEEKEEEDEDLG